MNPSLPAVVMVFASPCANLPTEVWQVVPDFRARAGVQNAPRTKDRAALLIPGLKIHPLRPALCARPERHLWQEPNADLVRTLAPDFDVFAFGYAQTAPLDAVAHSPGLRTAVDNLKQAGYKEVVLIGHSAGGVIARLFAAYYPDAGVTKVITVAAPHTGAEAANIQVGYARAQAPFIHSLAPNVRAAAKVSIDPKLEQQVEMACVVCKLRRLDGDGLVTLSSQWPDDCRSCGVPAVLVPVSHWDAMISPTSSRVIGELAREKLARWTAEDVEKARRLLFGGQAPQPPAPRRPGLLSRRLR
jgi:pimeloyl-ACP methyl ester carboxylesterase